MATTLKILVLSIVFAASAKAQPTAPPTPLSGGAAAPAASSGNQFKTIDAAIKELTAETSDRFGACISALDYLRSDLAATKRRVMSRDGKIPSNQAGLVAVKIKRVGRQQQSCIDMAKAIGGHFDLVAHSLAGVEPHNHPGIPSRRLKLSEQRDKFNAALKKLKVEGKNPVAPKDGDSADDGAAQ